MTEAIRVLEEKVAYLERHVTEQDKVMLELAEEIGELRRQLKVLRDRPAAAPGGLDDAASDERPPHY